MKTELAVSLQNMSPAEIKDQLESMCEGAPEEMTIQRELGYEESLQLKGELAQNAIKRAVLDDAFNNYKQEFKTQDNPLKLRNGDIIKTLRTNMIEEEGLVYSIANQDENRMEMYNEHGNLINVRPLLPNERQRNFVVESNIEKLG